MVSSLEITIFRFFGSSVLKLPKISLIAFEASIALALSLKDISRVTASCPLTLAYEVKSLKVLLENLLRYEDDITVDKKQMVTNEFSRRTNYLVSIKM